MSAMFALVVACVLACMRASVLAWCMRACVCASVRTCVRPYLRTCVRACMCVKGWSDRLRACEATSCETVRLALGGVEWQIISFLFTTG